MGCGGQREGRMGGGGKIGGKVEGGGCWKEERVGKGHPLC